MRYDAEIDLSNPNVSHTRVVELVGQARRVLDVGCATGYLGQALRQRGATVVGLEVDPEMAEEARLVLDEVVVADLNQAPPSRHFDSGGFDAIVFADVLEHLLDPQAVLADAVSLLAEDGCVVVSLPNITHASMRLALLQGRWDYTDEGILDRTHLRFFTRASLAAMVEAAGLEIETLSATVVDPLDSPIDVDPDAVPAGVVEWVRHQPDALVYQFVVRARRRDPRAEPRPRPALELPVALAEVRRTDEHTERLARLQRTQHEEMVLRDHVIGLEAALATAQSRLRQKERLLKRVRRENRQARVRAREARASARRARAEREALLASPTWRAGRLLAAPVRALRRRDGGAPR